MADNHKYEESDYIAKQLTSYFGICDCQRKIKSIVDALYSIYKKIHEYYENGGEPQLNGAEWLIVALMDAQSDAIDHGINCVHPIINERAKIWQWILKVKDNPELKDEQ